MCVYIHDIHTGIGWGHVTHRETGAFLFINTLKNKEEGLECLSRLCMCVYIYDIQTFIGRGQCHRIDREQARILLIYTLGGKKKGLGCFGLLTALRFWVEQPRIHVNTR